MYAAIRMLVVGIITAIVATLLIKKKPQHMKRIAIYSCIAWMIIPTALYFVSVENVLVGFNTPEEVFNYTTKGTIIDVVEGQDSAMIVYLTEKKTYSAAFSRKENNKWKIVVSSSYSSIHSLAGFFVFRIGKTDDHYLTGVVPGKNTVVKDSNDSVFNVFGNNFIYAYIGSIGDGYSINYGGKTVNYPDFKLN